MSPSSEKLSRLLAVLYEAAASGTLEAWTAFLEAVRTATAVDKAYFVLADPRHRADFSLQLGFDPSWQNAYAEHYHAHDPLYQGLMAAKRRHGEWAGTTPSVVAEAEFRGGVFYNEFIRPQSSANWSWAAVALSELDGGLDGGLGLQRTTNGGGPGSQPLGREQVALLRMLAPHLHRALNMYRAVSQLRAHNAAWLQGMDAMQTAMITLDERGQVLEMTPAARATLDAHSGLAVHGGRLRAMAPGERQRLEALTAGAIAAASGRGAAIAVRLDTRTAPEAGDGLWTPAGGGAMLVSRQPPQRPLAVTVAPFRTGAFPLPSSPAALVTISDPDAAPLPRAAGLQSLFGLTPAECRIADRLAAGQELAEIAAALRMTVGTARFHLKSIFRKTNTARQAELMRLLDKLPGDTR